MNKSVQIKKKKHKYWAIFFFLIWYAYIIFILQSIPERYGNELRSPTQLNPTVGEKFFMNQPETFWKLHQHQQWAFGEALDGLHDARTAY